MGSAKISKNKTRILRYFGDLAKLLWQSLNIDVDMIFRSAIFYSEKLSRVQKLANFFG